MLSYISGVKIPKIKVIGEEDISGKVPPQHQLPNPAHRIIVLIKRTPHSPTEITTMIAE